MQDPGNKNFATLKSTANSSERPSRSRKRTQLLNDYITSDQKQQKKNNIFQTSTPIANRKSNRVLNCSESSNFDDSNNVDTSYVTNSKSNDSETIGISNTAMVNSVEISNSVDNSSVFSFNGKLRSPESNTAWQAADGINSANITDAKAGVKRRGRPRKSDKTNNESVLDYSQNQHETSESIETPDRLGAADSTETSPSRVECERSNNSAILIHTDSDNSITSVNIKEDSFNTCKKKRGRPPKIKTVLVSMDSPEIKGEKDQQTNNDSLEVNNISINCDDFLHLPHQDIVNSEIKKKRGRPKKQLDISSNITANISQKDEQNRTFELSIQEITEESSIISSSSKHKDSKSKRGRPPKNINNSRLPATDKWSAEDPMGRDDPSKIIKILKYITCQKCKKQLKFSQYYQQHIEWCGRESEMVDCEICKKRLKARWYTIHLREHRKKEEALEQQKQLEKSLSEGVKDEVELDDTRLKSKRTAAKRAVKKISGFCNDNDFSGAGDDLDADFDEKVTDDEDDDDEVMEDEEREEESFRKSRAAFSGKKKINQNLELAANGQKMPARDAAMSDSDLMRYSTIVRYTENNYQNRFTILSSYYDGLRLERNNFPELRPEVDSWVPLGSKQCEKYLPVRPLSVKFVAGDSNNHQVKNVLDFGQAKVIQGTVYCNTGGPIWAMEWCPVPEGATSEQFLALTSDLATATHADIKTLHMGPGTIQIWSLGALQDDGSSSPSPTLSYRVAHDEGNVYSMSWCPAGCFDLGDEAEGSYLKRLGLLAVACTSARVLIYSLPQPSSLTSKSEGAVPTYLTEPALTLVPNSINRCGPCLSVAWQQGDRHQYILAGYGHGGLFLWDLLNKSPLLKVDPKTIRNFRSFLCIGDAISVCSWNPRFPSSFIAAGYEGKVYRWHVKADEIPIAANSSNTIFLYRSSCWAGPAIDGFFAAVESFRNSEQTPVLFMGSMTRTGLKHITCDLVMHTHSTATWDVSFNPVYEVLASCDMFGVLKVSLPPMMTLFTKNVKSTVSWHKHENPTAIVYEAKLGSLLKLEEGESSGDHLETHEETKESTQHLGEEVGEGETLYFKDCPMLQSSLTPYKVPVEKHLLFKLKNNLASIQQVRFNPNLACSLWLASGGQAGLLRLDNLSPLVKPLKPAAKKFCSSRVSMTSQTARQSLPQQPGTSIS